MTIYRPADISPWTPWRNLIASWLLIGDAYARSQGVAR